MMCVRFFGDALRARLGPAKTIRVAATSASIGYVLVLCTPALGAARFGIALLGWALAGSGMALVWPIASSVAGARFSGRTRGLSVVTTLSYGGGLAGPAIIGYVASATSLGTAMMIPCALAILVAVAAPTALTALTR